jgi:hypothetical protein
VILNTEKHS